MQKREKAEPEKICTRCGKLIRRGHEEITTERRTKLILCGECVRKGL